MCLTCWQYNGMQVSKGFVQLLECAQDQTLDVPETPAILSHFLVRASVDDILPHAFLKVSIRSLGRGFAIRTESQTERVRANSDALGEGEG